MYVHCTYTPADQEGSVPPLSRRRAAAKAGISPSQWSDVERGHKRAGSGVIVPVQATAETLARMARTVGVSAEELAAAGREDAAQQLRMLEHEGGLRKRIAAIPGLGVAGVHPLTGTDGKEMLPLIAEGLDAIEHANLPNAAKRDFTSMFVDNLIHDAVRRHAKLLLMLRIATGDVQSG